MPSATASGANPGGDSSARSRDHNQGNQGKVYTEEQRAAVVRIRKCNPAAFYDILALESVKTTCTEADIKKAYRKQSLLTHPDKNGHEHADEAFKMVSRAFGVLGDKEKREKYDKFGTDPDSRFASAQAQNPFSGFASRQASGGMGRGGAGVWEEEVSPEEMFARFFGGGGGPFAGETRTRSFQSPSRTGTDRAAFDAGPQFVFNLGGGPGIRVHQFGGARPRRRPREAQEAEQQQGGLQNLMTLLPILIFFILPMISSLFTGGSSGSSIPMRYDEPQPPYTERRYTPNHKVKYYVNPRDVQSLSKSKLSQLDHTAEANFIRFLDNKCEHENIAQRRLREDAMGWFYEDAEKMEQANRYPKPNCDRLRSLGYRRT
ncbi:Dna-J like membrane chaperone protein [Metarhizium album ARSEF 1941]|uniref:Dna-J like membrane chaperone protein n=1 Tax=Metarhizium album (strain ARSEF 1941) TaxID=1081103 RepID=A0A0B2WRC0_METAS|nr:Dna-J like membrane chaperone protein [Metarhizium album ARSEF 1941]KHN95525.1 Dna-J like membrane chaperone protein [Metarhizium album ARSEF 1941]